ncbi:MAG TPA: YciI family protein [Verrucomicrobiae bacterium]|nr:YciI family protein [Verrucomicrobiae bacterium]
MSTEAKKEFILFFRGSQWDKDLSPEEIQNAMGQFMGWFERLREEGRLKAGQPLERQGKIVSGKKGRTVADGPFAESKEAVGGYFLLTVADIDEAVEIAQQCPILEYGSTVEVRPVAEQCPTCEQHGIETHTRPVPMEVA